MEQGGRIASALRVARENLGLSLEQAASNAGIPLRYARVLEGESGPGIGIADSLYLIPFFRRYANCLGLKAEDLLPDFLGELQETPGATGSQARPSYRSPIALLWKPAAVAAAIALAVVLVNRRAPERPAFDDEQSADVPPQEEMASTQPGADLHPPTPEAADLPQTAGVGATVPSPTTGQADTAGIEGPAAAAVQAGAEAPSASRPTPSSDLALAPAEPGQGVPAHELRIVASEETWLALGVDDEPVKSVLLLPGESRAWTARATFMLTLGNAGGVTVVLDGSTLPSLGKSGQVVRNLRLPQGAASPPREG